MKKLLLISSLICCFTLVTAQEENFNFNDAGTWYLNGASSLTISFSDGTPIILGVGTGYFIIDNLVAGINFNYFNFDGNSDSSVALFARYYLSKAFLGGSVDLDGDTVFIATGGYEIFVSDNVSLSPTINYPFQDGADLFISVGVSAFF